MISMRALECLVTIVEQGSLTKAAAVLHMSQPALSHQIAAIERSWELRVIERLPRGHQADRGRAGGRGRGTDRPGCGGPGRDGGQEGGGRAGGRVRIACAETMTA